MDGEQVASSASADQTGGGDENAPPLSYKKLFERLCPDYMAMGMTYTEFWHGSADLPKYYREADKIRLQKKNQELWLEGLYYYSALISVAPVLIPFAKHPKPQPYMDFPIPLTEKEAEEQEQQRQKRKAELFKAQMLAWAEGINKQFAEQREVEEQEEIDDGGDRAEQNQNSS